ncbi:unnamed protein product [Candida verbasci]|uniref:Pre-mRNA-splicing factor PRP46 n=1 Tax=Candida verbasci TaxID=1227364 RepID=A0A9W4TXT4_9ASCO|nr:unnamed protein product [Candida verbasci]
MADLFDDLIPIHDDTIYTNIKQDYIFKNYTRKQEEVKQELEKSQDEESILKTSNWSLLKTLAGAHQGWIRSIAIDEITNKFFITGSQDSTIKIWDLNQELDLKTTLTGHIMGIRSLIISKKFPYLLSGSEDKLIKCWDLERTNSIEGCQIRQYYGHLGGIYAMSIHPEFDLLFSGGKDSCVRVWDIRSRNEIMILLGHRNDITTIETDSNDPQVITSSMDGTIRLWDLRQTKTELCITQHSKSIRSMKLHPNERTFVSGDSNGNIKQWILPEGDLLNDFEKKNNDEIINSLAINPISNQLFSGYDNGKIEIYDYITGNLLQSGKSPGLPGNENDNAIYSSVFDMSGLRLITGEGDKSIKIWGDLNNEI